MKEEYNVPMNVLEYVCSKPILDSFALLTKSTRFTWEENVVTFYYAPTDSCTDKIRHVRRVLDFIQPPNRPIDVDIILSPVKKQYPTTTVFDADHMNTGYTTSLGKMVIYRTEEWLKVFIHECFHFFNFEKALFDPQLSTRLLKIFRVKSNVHVYEAYCEVWARTLNCIIISDLTSVDFSILLKKETKYSMRHMVNILHHMGETYSSIQTSDNHYAETTDVLSYIVLTNILMQNGYLLGGKTPNEFMKSNIQEKCLLEHSEPLVRFIEENYNSEPMEYSDRVVPQVTTTMSLFSIDSFGYHLPANK